MRWCAWSQPPTHHPHPDPHLSPNPNPIPNPNAALIPNPNPYSSRTPYSQVRGVTKHKGSQVRLNTHVAQLIVDEEAGRAVGVATADGRRVMARKAVISNADLWSTRRLVTAGGGSADGRIYPLSPIQTKP